MKIKLAVIAGLVALGLGQVQAQVMEAQPNGASTKSWRFQRVDKDGTPISECWSIYIGEAIDEATMITTAKFRAIGNSRVWQCADNDHVPNCFFVDPPAGTNPCGAWRGVFTTNWGVSCPPTRPATLRYWMTRCNGNFTEVGSWTLHPRGNCADGYFDSNGLLEFTSPDCLHNDLIPPCTTFQLSSVHVSATGLVCCTQTDDTDSVQIFTMNGDGLTGHRTNLGVDMDWQVSARDNGNGTYTVFWNVTLTNTGNNCDSPVAHTFSGNRTQNYAESGQVDDTGADCETCHDGNNTEPGFRCSTAYCGNPYGICNQHWLFNLFGYGAHVTWTPAPR